MKFDSVVNTVPTIGFNVETVQPCKGVTFTVWDIGGQEKIRELWKFCYQDSDGAYYVSNPINIYGFTLIVVSYLIDDVKTKAMQRTACTRGCT